MILLKTIDVYEIMLKYIHKNTSSAEDICKWNRSIAFNKGSDILNIYILYF